MLPGRHGTGAGQGLHDRLLERLRGLGLHAAELWVVDGNERAQSFYRRNGWTHDGTTWRARRRRGRRTDPALPATRHSCDDTPLILLHG